MSCCAPGRLDRPEVEAGSLPAPGASVDFDWRHIPGGGYLLGGSDHDANPEDGEGPPRRVTLSSFRISATTVTNAQFAGFVKATGYRTEAERFGSSLVFHTLVSRRVARSVRRRIDGSPWWWEVPDASWRWPAGRGSHVTLKSEHPVVHVSWNDALAYCGWAGVHLPTEAQWEAAARGGLVGARYPWGDELTPGGAHMCNIWQGDFPQADTAEDGHHGTCPVKSFPPNGFGLFEVAGNVWEWCRDVWTAQPDPRRAGVDPVGPPDGSHRVIRGGSFLCHASHCNRYRVAARSANTPESATSNTGFRVVG